MGIESLTFNSIDVETANADRASICQIGIVRVQNGEIAEHWQTLVNPEEWFDPWNSSIHGIDEEDVTGSPTIPEIYDDLRARLRGSVLISHTGFDRVAFARAATKYELMQLPVTWLDSAKIASRAWPESFGRRGYGLSNIARSLGISFRHHDALEDARVVAEIVLHACTTAKADIDTWLRRVEHPINPTKSNSRSNSRQPLKFDSNPGGPLFGETILFTGALDISRREAAELAAESGCCVVDNASKKVTMLVVGTQDQNRLNGYKKSSKHRKTEALVMKGAEIQILSENDFIDLTRSLD